MTAHTPPMNARPDATETLFAAHRDGLVLGAHSA